MAVQARQCWLGEWPGVGIWVGLVMSPIHSYVIRVSLALNRDAWDVQVPGLGPASAPAIRDAVTLALVRHVERVGRANAQDALVFVTLEIAPDQIDDVITGAIA